MTPLIKQYIFFCQFKQLKIFYQGITTHYMSSTLSIDTASYHELDKEYPGISRNRKLLSQFCQKKIAILAELIKYNVPRAYYTQEIMQVDDLIQEIYEDSLQRGLLHRQGDYDLPAEIMRKITPISDQQEAEVILQNQTNQNRPNNKFTIQQIKAFIQKFNLPTDSQYVNRNIVNIACELSQCRKQKACYENFDPKEKEKNIAVGQKFASRTKENPEKKEIIITMGDRIPIAVREMRNYVKKISQESFAVNSQKMELEKTDFERKQTLISLSLNKIAKENLLDIFGDIEPLIISSEKLATYFVCEALNKCLIQPKMAEVYLQFICLFTKISKKYFNWNWSQQRARRKNINSIHRLTVEKLQELFNKEIGSTSSPKNLKHITFIIGNLIFNKKLSRKVFVKVGNLIISKILTQNQKQAQEDYFEAFISLIQAMKQSYEENWATTQLSEIFTPENFSALCAITNQQQQTMEDLLIALSQHCNFSTSRIKCLVQNLFSRKELQDEPENSQRQKRKQTPTCCESKIRQLLQEQNGFPQIFKLYSENKSSSNLLTILMALFDDKHKQVQINTDRFIEENNIPREEFDQFWQEQYMNLMYGECDLPYMVESLAKIMKQYSSDLRVWIIEPEKDDEDYEDVEYFMEKIAHAFNQAENHH